jgi:hypothetical protein
MRRLKEGDCQSARVPNADRRRNLPIGSALAGPIFDACSQSVLCGLLPRCKCDLMIWRIGRVQSSVRPVDAVGKETAGPDGVREPGPILLIRL